MKIAAVALACVAVACSGQPAVPSTQPSAAVTSTLQASPVPSSTLAPTTSTTTVPRDLVDLRLFEMATPERSGARVHDLGRGTSIDFDARRLVDVALLPDGDVLVANFANPVPGIDIELHTRGGERMPVASRLGNAREGRLYPDERGTAVWVLVGGGPSTPLALYRYDHAARTAALVQPDLRTAAPITTVASTRGLFLANEDRTTTFVRADGSTRSLGEGRVLAAAGSRFVRGFCTTHWSSNCRLQLEDVDDPSVKIPLGLGYDHAGVITFNGFPLTGAPLPAVTRDGRKALMIATTGVEGHAVELDLATGVERRLLALPPPEKDPWLPIYSRNGDYIALIRTSFPSPANSRVDVRLISTATGEERPVHFEVPPGRVILTAG